MKPLIPGVSKLKGLKCKNNVDNIIIINNVQNIRKDVRLPVQLQRAMAAEAEATREAKAKVSY